MRCGEGRNQRRLVELPQDREQRSRERRTAALTALVELLHTGSIVVDDVEDDAPMRRGRPAVHAVGFLDDLGPTGLYLP